MLFSLLDRVFDTIPHPVFPSMTFFFNPFTSLPLPRVFSEMGVLFCSSIGLTPRQSFFSIIDLVFLVFLSVLVFLVF